ncbi:MAG: flagellar basal body P-ring formation protein FlgA [Giesbergeria sp.]|nr:flagellar basal body P-ring formation protein FlgA [Giesbergeria sp.]
MPISFSSVAAAALAAIALVATPARAQTPSPAELSQITQSWIDTALQQTPQSTPLRMEVDVGALDERLRLAPCARIEPYLPAGARLWGRSRLGLRCLEGTARWNVFLPLTIKAFGPAWVLTSNVPAGTALTEADAMQAEVDWAAEPASVLADPSLWVGQVASRPLVSGQALRQSMLRAPHAFKVGAQVRVVAEGPGYAVTSMGQALVAGAVGQTVRIRMTNGRIITGIVDETGAVAAAL